MSKIDIPELTDRIYDTLMGNVGMSEHHVVFDPKDIEDCEVDARLGIIRFVIDDEMYEVRVKKTPRAAYVHHFNPQPKPQKKK
jgi:hypothetical protein